MADHGIEPDGCDRAEQQTEDATHHRHRNALQQGAELADEGQGDGEHRSPGHDLRVVVLGQHHRAGHLGVGSVGRSAEQAGCRRGDAVTQQRAVQARCLQVVPSRHAAHRDDPADMLDGRRQGHGHDEQDGLPVEGRGGEVGQFQPGRRCNLRRVDHPESERQGKTHQHAGDDRHQAEDAFAEHGYDQRRQQGRHGNQHGGAVGQQHATIASLAHRHVGRDRCHGQADGDDHRADHHRGQHTVDEACALDLHHQAHEGVDEPGGHDATHGFCQTELALGENDRGDEGKARCQENRHLTPGHQLKQQGAKACGEQRDVRVQAGNQGHQHQRAKCHEEHLRA